MEFDTLPNFGMTRIAMTDTFELFKYDAVPDKFNIRIRPNKNVGKTVGTRMGTRVAAKLLFDSMSSGLHVSGTTISTNPSSISFRCCAVETFAAFLSRTRSQETPSSLYEFATVVARGLAEQMQFAVMRKKTFFQVDPQKLIVVGGGKRVIYVFGDDDIVDIHSDASITITQPFDNSPGSRIFLPAELTRSDRRLPIIIHCNTGFGAIAATVSSVLNRGGNEAVDVVAVAVAVESMIDHTPLFYFLKKITYSDIGRRTMVII